MILVTKYLKCPTECDTSIATVSVVLVLILQGGTTTIMIATSTYGNGYCFFGKILLIVFSWLIVQSIKRKEFLKGTGKYPLFLISGVDDKWLLQKVCISCLLKKHHGHAPCLAKNHNLTHRI